MAWDPVPRPRLSRAARAAAARARAAARRRKTYETDFNYIPNDVIWDPLIGFQWPSAVQALPSASKSRWTSARYGLRGVRVGEASNPGPPGGPNTDWAVTEQPTRRQTAACRCCHRPFAPGDARVRPRHSDLRQGKHFHPACIPGGLGPLGNIEGLSEVGEKAKAEVQTFADGPGMSRDAYVASKRRRRHRAQPEEPEPADPPPVQEAEDPDGAFEDGALRNLEWWDHVAARDLEWVPTIANIPEPLLHACAEARAAVLLSLRHCDSQSVEAARLWKLLDYMDRLLFARTSSRKGSKNKKVDQIISHRLHLFWRGSWQQLWSASRQCGREARYSSTAGSSASEIRRIESLLLTGELSKAAASVARKSDMEARPGTVDKLKALFDSNAAGLAVPPSEDMDIEGPSEQRRAAIEKEIASPISRFPRLAGAGPSGSRYEHWGTLRRHPEAL